VFTAITILNFKDNFKVCLKNNRRGKYKKFGFGQEAETCSLTLEGICKIHQKDSDC
jgi:hypothetical protein